MKKIFIVSVILLISITALSQSRDAEDVKLAVKKYSDAIEKLDVKGTENLFKSDSQIFESGGSEGTYAHYLEHHLISGFKKFTSFKYNNYKVGVQVKMAKVC